MRSSSQGHPDRMVTGIALQTEGAPHPKASPARFVRGPRGRHHHLKVLPEARVLGQRARRACGERAGAGVIQIMGRMTLEKTMKSNT